MPRERLEDVLDECLAQLRSGVGLEDVLAQHRQMGEELRPLLETALLVQPNHAQASGLHTAQNRSRARFLGAASQRRRPASPLTKLRLAGMRMATAIALVVVLFIGSLVGSGLASAKAVPGQALYPVKRAVEQAQLVFTTSQVSRIELEESFDQRRANETEELIHTGQTEKVQFAGILHEDPQAGWVVDQSLLILSPDQEALARELDGSYVEVNGTVRGEAGVQVSNLQLRLFQVSGALQSVQANEWIVSGIHVQIQTSTKVMGNPRPGARVEISALRLSDGQLVALSAKIKGSSSSNNNGEDKKDTPETEFDNETPAPEVTIGSGDDDHGSGKEQQTAEPTSTPKKDPDAESTPESDAISNSPQPAAIESIQTPTTGQNVLEELTATSTPDLF